MPAHCRAVALLRSRGSDRAKQGRRISAGRSHARSVALPDLWLHHALDPDRPGLPAPGGQPQDIRSRAMARSAATADRWRELLARASADPRFVFASTPARPAFELLPIGEKRRHTSLRATRRARSWQTRCCWLVLALRAVCHRRATDAAPRQPAAGPFSLDRRCAAARPWLTRPPIEDRSRKTDGTKSRSRP